MAQKERILIINLGWEQQPLIDFTFEYEDADVYGIHNSDSYLYPEKYEKVLKAEFRELELIVDFARNIDATAVVSDQCDYSHFAQALVAERLHLPGPSLRDAQVSLNKYVQRNLASEKGIRIPDYKLVVELDEAAAFGEEFGYPIILKPVDNRGSIGVSKVGDASELSKAFYHALINSHSRLVIAEVFIEGQELTIDGYMVNGEPISLSLAAKGKVDEKKQVSVDIKYPGDIDSDIYAKAMAHNERVITQLGYSFGMTHSEYLIDKFNNIYLVEAANRGGGVFTSEIIMQAVSGFDALRYYVNDVLKIENSSYGKSEVQRNEVILKFFSFEVGKIAHISGKDDLDADIQVLAWRFAVKEGDVISPITSDANRHGFFIATAENDVRKKADDLLEKIRVTYEN